MRVGQGVGVAPRLQQGDRAAEFLNGLLRPAAPSQPLAEVRGRGPFQVRRAEFAGQLRRARADVIAPSGSSPCSAASDS